MCYTHNKKSPLSGNTTRNDDKVKGKIERMEYLKGST